jgi:hypothetical protein
VADLREAGFYELRGASTAVGSGRPIAVNVDLAESDLARFDPRELVAAVTAPMPGPTAGTPQAGPANAGVGDEQAERRQTLWWFLLLAALLCAGAETVLSNRLSSRAAS